MALLLSQAKKSTAILALIICSLFHQSAFPVSQYLLADPLISNDIEHLVVVADLSAMSKPYPLAMITTGLKRIQHSHPALYSRITQFIAEQQRSLVKTAGLTGALARDDAAKVLSNRHGQTTNADYLFNAVIWGKLSSYAAISLGGEYSNHRSRNAQPTNSFLSLGTGYFQADLGYRDHWFSPGYLGSFLISTHAPASPSVTISNYTPLPLWGIHYELFYSQLEQVEGIRADSGVTSGRPGLLGMQLSFQPIAWFSLSLNRMLMFGGGDRAATLGDIWQGIMDPVNKDNTATLSEELGNQIASISTAVNFNPGLPLRLYFSYAAEDTAGLNNTNLGNLGILAGVYFPRIKERLSLRYELNEWQTAWYTHHLYQYGYTNNGHVMGHWLGDARVFGDNVGGLSNALQLSYRQQNNAMLSTTYRQLTNDSYSSNDYVTGREIEVHYQYPLSNKLSTGVMLYTGRSVMDSQFYSLRLSLRWL